MFANTTSRWTAKASLLLLVAPILADVFVTSATAQSNSGWSPRGTSGSQQSPSAPAANNPWRLPNGQVVPAQASHTNGATANSLRNGQPVKIALREPRTLDLPVDARPIASAPSAASGTRSTAVQQHTPSSAITQTAAAIPAQRPANTVVHPSMRQQPNNPQPNIPRIARAMPPKRGVSHPNTSRMWKRMDLAMNAEEWAGESEDLPLPGPAARPADTSDPFGSDPNNYYLNDDVQYHPGGCGPDGCGDTCGCGEGCCEPGCGCGCGGECCDDRCCNDCLSIGPGDDESCHQVRMRVPKWQELAIFAGVQGFKNPYDQERDGGNFGFHEGFNAGFKIPYTYVGYQVGYEAAQSQLNGDENTGDDESHTQHFTTFGLYRRCQDGLQFGSAWDTLVDQRFEARTFHQIRNEISWVDACTHEFGLSATVGIMDHEDPDDDSITWEARDQYVLFYRVHGKHGGEGRFFGGWSDDSDGIVGADMLLPVHDRWSVQTGFTYMIPDARDGVDGASEEAWNINLAMVWHWGCTARSSHNNPYRPLFNVANNGSMIIDSSENN